MAKIQPCPVKMKPHIYAALVFFTQLKGKRAGDTLTTWLKNLWLGATNASVDMIAWAFEANTVEENEKVYDFLRSLEDKYRNRKKWPSERTLNNIFLQDDYYKKMKENRELRKKEMIWHESPGSV